MRVAIDITPLESGHKSRGTGRYTKALIDSLQQFDTINTYHFFTRTQKIPDGVDIVHFPYFEPFFLTLPTLRNRSVVVTVHDLIPIEYWSHFSIGVRGYIKWQIQRAKLRLVTRIITDSLASKQAIKKLVGFREERIDMIPLAPSEFFLRQKPCISKTELLTAYGIKNDYFLYVGDVNWNKNVLGIIKAFKHFIDQNKIKFDLVLVGKTFQNSELVEVKALNAYIDSNNLGDMIHLVGGVSDEDLYSFYSHSIACLLVSIAEGFGFPVLEAMVAGCPVITSNTSSLHEIAGPSIQVDPWNISDIAAGLEIMIHSNRQKLIREGKKWVKNYTWEKVARLTIQTYEKAYHHHTGI